MVTGPGSPRAAFKLHADRGGSDQADHQVRPRRDLTQPPCAWHGGPKGQYGNSEAASHPIPHGQAVSASAGGATSVYSAIVSKSLRALACNEVQRRTDGITQRPGEERIQK